MAALNVELGDLKLAGNGSTRAASVDSDRDRRDLMRLGKLPALKRAFGFMQIVGFTCTIIITWEAVLIITDVPIHNGGPAGFVYGFLIVWAGTFAVFASLAELASMAPTSGGQYHWVSMLAPAHVHRFLSYVTGWLTVIGWQGAIATANYVTATIVQGLVVLTRPGYEPQQWHTVLLFWAAMAFAVFVVTVLGPFLPKVEGLVMLLHVLGFFAVLIPLVILGDHQRPYEVFGQFLNGGHLPTQGLSMIVGIIGPIFMFLGVDGAIHMSEEIHNAAMVVPRSILFSILVNGIMGFAMIMAVLFTASNLEMAMESPTHFPGMALLVQATGSLSGATVMYSIITIMQFAANISILAACSRMTWSFARDKGLPGWRTIQKVDNRYLIPFWSILTTTVISVLLSLIIFGSSAVFNIVVSVCVAGLFSSYAVAISLLLYRRLTGGIRHLPNSTSNDLANTSGAELLWGPWCLPNRLGVVVNVAALVYMTFILFFSFWPSTLPATPQNMNFSSLIFGAAVIFSTVWYFAVGKKDYNGPVIEVQPSRLNI